VASTTLSERPRTITWHVGLVVGAQALGWLVLALGLIAPLTPSEGPPPWTDVAIWLGSPVLLVGWAAWRARSWVTRTVIVLEIGVMIYLTWRLALGVW
jgi:hypothetical protein